MVFLQEMRKHPPSPGKRCSHGDERARNARVKADNVCGARTRPGKTSNKEAGKLHGEAAAQYRQGLMACCPRKCRMHGPITHGAFAMLTAQWLYVPLENAILPAKRRH
jgi:hypothetical protein